MEKEIKKMKYEEQKKLLEKISSMDPTSEEYDTVLDKIKSIDSMLAKENELMVKREQNKAELDFKREQLEEQKESNKAELDFKREQLEEQKESNKAELVCKKNQLDELKKELIVKYGVEIGLSVLTLIFYGRWMNKGFRFEETGALCSFTFKNLISNFKPKRK